MTKSIPPSKTYLQVPCPTCKAEIGENCHFEPGEFRICCTARATFVPQKNFPVMARVHRIRGEGSHSCQKKHHSSCSGNIRLKHGLGTKPCGCSCHRAKPAAAAPVVEMPVEKIMDAAA